MNILNTLDEYFECVQDFDADFCFVCEEVVYEKIIFILQKWCEIAHETPQNDTFASNRRRNLYDVCSYGVKTLYKLCKRNSI